MPIERTIIAGLLEGVVKRAVIAIAGYANRAQIDLDTYVAQQATTLTPEQVRALVFGGSSVTRSLSESFITRITAVISGSYNQAWQSGMQETQERTSEGGARMYRWRTNSSNTCPDCAARNGRVQSWKTWELVGMPKSGFSVCGANCKCSLEPES